MAEWVGFEPTVPSPVHLISSQGRYNHFDTTPQIPAARQNMVIIPRSFVLVKAFLRKWAECRDQSHPVRYRGSGALENKAIRKGA